MRRRRVGDRFRIARDTRQTPRGPLAGSGALLATRWSPLDRLEANALRVARQGTREKRLLRLSRQRLPQPPPGRGTETCHPRGAEIRRIPLCPVSYTHLRAHET